MTNFVLTPAAQADVEEIWTYTVGRWGEAQAAAYIGAIGDACRDLASGARISRPVDVRAGYRKSAVGSHVIFFTADGAEPIVVVRVVHRRMDAERHLPGGREP